MNSNKLQIDSIIQERLSPGQFIAEEHPKSQIYLHHTAGGGDAKSVARFWNGNSSKIGTAFVIGERGEIVQCFSSKHWGWHLGVGTEIFKANKIPFLDLNKTSIGIELTNWGMLKTVNGKFVNYVNKVVPSANVTTLDEKFKGHLYWYRYTDEQIESLRKLVEYLCETYDIPKEYNEEIWDIDLNALKNKKGIYTHNSVRRDKSDVYPCPRLIEMLKNL
jgi:N-acetyl-anhydromuramyl-L-alanine amidase AmpD